MRNEYAGNNEKALTTDGKDKSRVHLTTAEIASVFTFAFTVQVQLWHMYLGYVGRYD